MTTPQGIENLIKPYGQTLEDLPKPVRGKLTYSNKDQDNACTMALQWAGLKPVSSNDPLVNCMTDFICHQSAVIEKLVSALDKALEADLKEADATVKNGNVFLMKTLIDNYTGKLK